MRWLPVLVGGAVAAGCALGILTCAPVGVGVAAAIGGLVAAGFGLVTRRPVLVLAASLSGFVAAASALASEAERAARVAPLEALLRGAGDPVTLEGRLSEDASPSPSGVRLRLEQDGWLISLTVSGTLAVDQYQVWRAGRRIRVPATVRRPARYLNPGVPDHRLAMARRGLALVGSVKSGALVELVDEGGWASERAAALRAYGRAAIETRVGAGTGAAVARAILFGDRAGLDPETIDRLQAAGTYHVIAISGGNIAVLAGLLILGFRVLRAPPPAGAAVSMVLLVGYAGLVGGDPSVVRATSMAVAYLGLRLVDLRTAPINALATAAGAMLIVSPLSACEPGFVLTVGATAALILLAQRLVPSAATTPVRRLAAGLVAASVATEIALLPVAALLFNRVTAAGLVLNLAAVPLMSVVQLGSLAVVALDRAVPALAAAAGAIVGVAAGALVDSTALVEVLPGLARRVPPPAPWAVAAYLASIVGVILLPRVPLRAAVRAASRRIATLAAVSVAVWILVHPWTWRWPWSSDGRLRVTFLDVGQGDATLIELPAGQRILVDAGGLPGSRAFDVGTRVVAPALWARGVGRVDSVVLTHGDPDHVGGVAGLFWVFRPVSVWEGIPVPAHATLQRLRADAREAGIAWHQVYAGTVIAGDEASVRLVHPDPPDWERPRVRNDDSVVLDVRIGGVSIVLPGDIGADVEPVVGNRVGPAPIRILKAPHHGSASSSSEAFLDALAPAAVIVSCGRDNRYGHPAPAVLERYAARGIEVLRTDRDGAITVTTDGRHVDVSTFTGRKLTFNLGATRLLTAAPERTPRPPRSRRPQRREHHEPSYADRRGNKSGGS